MPEKAPTMLENDMESKRYQKLLEYYKAVLNDKPLLKLCAIRASDYLMPERDIDGTGIRTTVTNT